MKVVLNSHLIESESAALNIQSAAVMYGFGFFETLKIKHGEILYFREHYERLSTTCKQFQLTLEPSADELLNQAQQLVELNQHQEGVLKINVFKTNKAPATLISSSPPRYSKGTYKTGFRLGIAANRVHSQSLLSGHKSCNYMSNLLCLERARAAGCDEAVSLNESNHLTEGCTTNLFFVRDRKLCTPAVSCGLLNGIMRQVVLKAARACNIACEEGLYSVDELAAADELFLTNSLVEMMPVRQLVYNAGTGDQPEAENLNHCELNFAIDAMAIMRELSECLGNT